MLLVEVKGNINPTKRKIKIYFGLKIIVSFLKRYPI